MKIDLQSKLKNCLSLEEIREADVVYILVEIGKLIEQGNIHEEHTTLWFYRNWVAHPKVTKQSAFVRNLKEKLRDLHSDQSKTFKLFGFVSFIELQNDLIRFFHQQIEKDLIPSKAFLNNFREALVQVIADVPVIIELDDNEKITLSYDMNGELKIEGPGTINGSINVLR